MQRIQKYLKPIAAFLIVLVALALGYLIFTHVKIQRGELIKWEGEWYTSREWQAKFGEYNTPAQNTPEEVYASFRQALLDNDPEKALGYMTENKREEYREKLEKGQKDGLTLYKIGSKYPLNITKDHEYDNYSSYNYQYEDDGEFIDSIVEFRKNREGVWLIDAI